MKKGRAVVSVFFIISLIIQPARFVFADDEPTYDASDIADGTLNMQGISGGEESLNSSNTGATRESDTTAIGINKYASTDMSSGAFSYRIPIEVPEGRNGLTPNISLGYNSNDKSNDSIVGYGWSFDIPYITRINKHGSENLYEHNDFSSSLSGELVNITGDEYGAKVENGDFLKYTYDEDNGYWIVYDKNGTRYTFGQNAQARQQDESDPDVYRVYKWMLEEVRDANDNFIRYEYFKNSGQIYPEQVIYTGNGTTDGIYEINFNNTLSDMSPKMYYADFEVKTKYRITDVQVRENSQWIKKYAFSYSTADNGYRQLLASITESGRDVASNTTITKRPITFSYKTRGTIQWVEDTNWKLPMLIHNYYTKDPSMLQIRDINGDAYPDVLYSEEMDNTCNGKETYLNKGNGTWTQYTCPDTPFYLKSNDSKFKDKGTRMADYNGDYLADALRSWTAGSMSGTPDLSVIYKNTGDVTPTWAVDTNAGGLPLANIFGNNLNADNGVQHLDFNGDGLSDIVRGWIDDEGAGITRQAFIGNGDGSWNQPLTNEWSIPYAIIDENPDGKEVFTFGQWMDLNGDGLTDFAFKREYGGWGNGYYYPIDIVALNTGHAWNGNSDWLLPFPTQGTEEMDHGYSDMGVRNFDVNGDGISDIVISRKSTIDGSINSEVNINTMDENKTSNSTSAFVIATNTSTLPAAFANTGDGSLHTVIADINADGMEDLIVSEQVNGTTVNVHTYLAQVTPFTDMLVGVSTPEGASSQISYKLSTKYFDGSGNILNPKLPIAVTTVDSLTTNDGNGNTTMKNYTYADGSYYYNNPQDRKFAGFGLVTTTDSVGNLTKTYYHQGNSSNSSIGEYDDHSSKIGKVYREEVYDNAGNLYQKTINKWDKYNLGTGRDFVKNLATVISTYDGGSSHKDKAEENVYDNTNGNLTQKIEYGEVAGANNGTFTDTGSDKRTTNYSYASNATANIIGLPSKIEVQDSNSSKIAETVYYYDNQIYGNVLKGNKTKESAWISGPTYSDNTYSYNSYGLVTDSYDPRNNNTHYVYDSYNLYPVTVTNALSHQTSYVYNYLNGKPIQITTPNGAIYIVTYDGLGRPVQEQGPDPTTGLNVVKKTYSYNDSTLPLSTTETTNLATGLSNSTHTYVDGLGRTTQKKIQAEGGNYSTVDYIYNNRGLLYKDSLPYFTTSSAKSTPTTTPNLLTTHSYDPIGRVITVVNVTGTVTNVYSPWENTTTDQLSNAKKYAYDAYSNLVAVTEYVGPSNTYVTNYAYDQSGNLTRITDSLGNTRAFGYDGLNRKLFAEDLHDPFDTTYGHYIYGYDLAGNIIMKTDPKTQVVQYVYDAINRVMSENYTGSTGTDIVYLYDGCTNGIGYLCQVNTTSNTDTFEYTKDSQVKKETRTISTVPYVTEYVYNYQGAPTEVKYPDASYVRYGYNVFNKVESVDYKKDIPSPYSALVTNFNYGPDGKMTTRANSNGVNTTYTYDANNLYRLSQINSVDSLMNNIQNIAYTYDSVGNITGVNDTSTNNASKIAAYVYDPLYRLTSATITNAGNGSNYTHTFTYGQTGNILSKSDNAGTYQYRGNAITGSYANPHAVTDVGTNTYTYDNNGNLTNDSTGKMYAWDYRNRMINTAFTTPPSAISYAYDQNNSRIKYQTLADTTIYPNKYYNIKNATNITKHIFVGDAPIATIEKVGVTENKFYIHQDHLEGSSVITNNGGQTDQLLDYYPYGTIRINQQNSTFNEQRKYIGQYHDDATNLEYLNARYYDSLKGQFTNQDPVFWEIGQSKEGKGVVFDPQLQNSYSYARDNPIVNKDPNGRCLPFCAMAGAIALVPYIPQITSYLSSLATPLGQFAIGEAVNDANKGNYGMVAFGLITAGEVKISSGETKLFRTMKEGVDGMPEIGQSASRLGARAGRDIGVESGFVKPNSGGISVNTGGPENISNKLRSTSFGGESRNPTWCITCSALPKGIKFVKDSMTHGTIQPTSNMTFEKFNELIQSTKSLWKKVK